MVAVAEHASPDVSDPSRGHRDAIVIGGGHNGLITAAYLARAGVSTLLIEARRTVGGCASSEAFGGATVNVCNCDHLTFRTTPVMDELDLGLHGLRYLDVDPAQVNMAWSGGPAWTAHHDVERTLDELARSYPHEVDGYRRYVRDARPAVEMVLEAATEPPSIRRLTQLAVRRRLEGAPTLLRWSRRNAADVLRGYFSTDALAATAAVTGPMVWGVGPGLAGTGLGALTHALRHVGRIGRPVGGSGALPRAVEQALLAAGGEVVTDSLVGEILCDDLGARGVRLVDGTEHLARIVISACDPHSTFVRWLRSPPPSAESLVARWRAMPARVGYESKIDAVVTEPPVLRAVGTPIAATTVIAPSLDEIDRGARLLQQGQMLDQPALLANVPTVLDATMAPASHPDRHVVSLEVLFTPYDVAGGWPSSSAPDRWLEQFAELCEPGFLDSIVDHRSMTPDVYERDFHLPSGHAASFAGGPLAVLRNRNPELTRYETAVPGLYITGAATFPGAGVWGASGRNCAAVVIEHLDRRSG